MPEAEELLATIPNELIRYRAAVDALMGQKNLLPSDFRDQLRQVHLVAARLYADYVGFHALVPNLQTVRRKARVALPKVDINREMHLRERLQELLERCDFWHMYRTDHAFASDFDLHTTEDYVNALYLHLPEAYEETYRLGVCLPAFADSRDGHILSLIDVAFRHMAANHLLFVLPVLEFLCNETNWND